jgi:ABC-2 type transport system permease protein
MNTLARLEVLRLARDKRFAIFAIGMPSIFYLIFGAQKATVSGTDFARYYMVSMAVYGALIATMNVGGPRIAADRQVGWTRQLRLTSLTGTQYFAAKSITAITVGLVAVLPVFLIGALVNHVTMPAGQWVGSAVAVWLASLAFAALGILIGYLGTPSSVQPIMMLVSLGISMLGGLWWPISILPTAMQDVAKVLPTYHVAQIAHNVQAGGAPALVNVVVVVAYFVGFGMIAAWLYRRDEAKG